jgi:hypothetical protein
LPVATGIGSRALIGDEGIEGMFIPPIPAIPGIPAIPPDGFAAGRSGGGVPAFGTDPGIPGMPAIPPIPDIPPVPGRAVALGMALDAALGIPLAELLAAVAIEETMDPRLETVEMADVTAGRLPLPLPSGATQPFTPGRLTQTLDGT